MLGIDQPYRMIYEFEYKNYLAHVIWTYDKRELMKYALTYDNDSTIYITGGECSRGFANNQADAFKLSICDIDEKVKAEKVELPPMKEKRFNHTSFIMNEFLFVMFGKNEKQYC